MIPGIEGSYALTDKYWSCRNHAYRYFPYGWVGSCALVCLQQPVLIIHSKPLYTLKREWELVISLKKCTRQTLGTSC